MFVAASLSRAVVERRRLRGESSLWICVRSVNSIELTMLDGGVGWVCCCCRMYSAKDDDGSKG